VDHARSLLEAEQDRVLRRLAVLTGEHRGFVEASLDSNADDEHDPEGATIAFERSQVEALVRQAETRLAEVAAALERLDAGTYGACAACGEPVPAARLAARPAAATCVVCAAR
jgi:RNA polymerase-binding transcription factor DksA